jgi:TIR domain
MSAFLSYAAADRKVAERLKDELGKSGLSVWSDTDVTVGQEWRRRIEDAIQSASEILVLVGPKNGDDPWQQLTWRAALEAVWQDPNKRLIPILLRGATPPPFLYSAASGGHQFLRLDDFHNVKDVVREIAGLIQGKQIRSDEGREAGDSDPKTQTMSPDSNYKSPPDREDRLSEIKEYATRLRSHALDES